MFDVSAPWASFWYDVFNGMLFLGAFAVAAGTYGSIKMGAVKERFSDERISANEAETKRAIADSDIAKKDAAEANLKLETEKLARLKLEEKLAPRTLADPVRSALIASLSPFNGKLIRIVSDVSSTEARGFAAQLGAMFEDSGWNVSNRAGELKPPVVGIEVWVNKEDADAQKIPPRATAIVEAFRAIGIEVPLKNEQHTGSGDVVLEVGVKP